MADKTNPGNFFEDFSLGQKLVHATPRTVTEGEAALYTALYGSRFAFNCADTFAMDLGLEGAPLDDMLVFHMIFGRSVADVSLNAVANLGYATGRFGVPVYPGDTLKATTSVIGLKPNSNGKTGIVWVRTEGSNQKDERVVDFVRWVMVNKGDPDAEIGGFLSPEISRIVPAAQLTVPDGLDLSGYDVELSGSPHLWDDYEVGERIDHVDGHTIEEAEHQMATRLYQNSSRVHLDAELTKDTRFGKRLVYGGHVISIARALSFNGFANAFKVAAISGGAHAAPVFAGDTIYAWSEVLSKDALDGRDDVAALRLRTVACKNHTGADFSYRAGEDDYDPCVVLDLDYTVLMPTGK